MTTTARTRYFEAPDYYRPAAGDPPAVFLAGGITGCTDWQAGLAEQLLAEGLVVLNPRRTDFPIHDPAAAPEQIAWEHHHLHLEQVVTAFWFAAETVQPIALLELGAALDNPRRRIAVGAHPLYPRRLDVVEQTRLARPGQPAVSSTLDGLAAAVIEAVGLP
ncbi:nucleoside 2-deoxyribosyltransferase domain-containing protein [Kitasatospora sp. NPDC086801]|uniref:nucleoside 2-deoxyribosyltransferase domain-containing protein n=1 Tax=Kitasatospora sp. NPDC086801 TaxID=3364066 RepID=UPI00382852E5